MNKLFCAVISCFFLMMGLASIAAAADPVEPTSTSRGSNPTNNGWGNK